MTAPESESKSPRVSFGTFEANLRTGELRKQGTRIKLQEQPFQVLAMLLERPGEIVTREDLRERLWPAEVFVDFDQSLNKAINKIREALNDSADSPRFVETLARRGYRFIAPLHSERSALSQSSAEKAKDALPSSEVIPEPESNQTLSPALYETASLEGTPPVPRQRRWALGLALGFSVVVGVLTYFLTRPLPQPRVVSYRALTNDGSQKLPTSNLITSDIITDGSRLYFTRNAGPYLGIAQVSTSGGVVAPVSFPLWDEKCDVVTRDFSPDRRELLVTVDSARTDSAVTGVPEVQQTGVPLWVVPVVGGSGFRLGNLRAHWAKWSPNGKQIAYSLGVNLYVARSDGNEPRKLWTAPPGSYLGRVTWSADGNHLFSSVWRSGFARLASIYRISLDASSASPLIPSWNNTRSHAGLGVFSDGTLLVFVSTTAGRVDIWGLREKQGFWPKSFGQPFQLTAGPLSFLGPTPSPDGRTLFAVGDFDRGEMLRYDNGTRQFVPHLSGISAEMAAYSRDAQWVAYVSYPEGILWRCKVDGSQRVQLTMPPLQIRFPRCSPDGRTIAFSAAAFGPGALATAKTYLVSAEGGGLERLVPGPCSEADASWAPEGSRLVFAPSPAAVSTSCALGIRIVDLKTREVTLVPGSDHLFAPSWSSDGTRLLALTSKDLSLDLFDFSTGRWSHLLEGPVEGYTWSSDGKSIYVYYQNSWIARYQIKKRKLERLVSTRPFRRLVDGWLGQTPAGDILVTRDLGTTEIYALDLETR